MPDNAPVILIVRHYFMHFKNAFTLICKLLVVVYAFVDCLSTLDLHLNSKQYTLKSPQLWCQSDLS